MNSRTVAGEDCDCPIYGPEMKIVATGEICPVLSHGGIMIELQTANGPRDFKRKELDFADF